MSARHRAAGLRNILWGAIALFAFECALAGCAAVPHQAASHPAPHHGARVDLYCGMSRPDGSTVSEQEWSAFMEGVVVPALPDGFTVFNATGVWSEHRGAHAVSESTRVITCIGSDEESMHPQIDAIAAAWVRQFHQENVLVVWSTAAYYFQ